MVGARGGGAELAPARIAVFLMMRLERGEEIQFERDTRMPRRHDAVGDELPLARRSELAVDAHPSAHHRVLELAQADAQVGKELIANIRNRAGAGHDPGIVPGNTAPAGPGAVFDR